MMDDLELYQAALRVHEREVSRQDLNFAVEVAEFKKLQRDVSEQCQAEGEGSNGSRRSSLCRELVLDNDDWNKRAINELRRSKRRS